MAAARIARLAFVFLVCLTALRFLGASAWAAETIPATTGDGRVLQTPQVDSESGEEGADEKRVRVRPASNLQPQPFFVPEPELPTRTRTPEAPTLLPESGLADRAGRRGEPPVFTGLGGLLTDRIPGSEAEGRLTTDVGDLLGASPMSLGEVPQRRTPIVNDPRVRGSRVGQLAASGSYWVPARLDLDTAVSKIDSRLVDQVTVVKGPYSALYGPGFRFMDVELLKSPRYEAPSAHGASSLNYKANGQQWYGRQDFWGGSQDWGFRVGYGHATADDYLTGGGFKVGSGYHSRDLNLMLGWNPSCDERLEFTLLRLDQTGVEFPGQAFDIDVLTTDGFELEYTRRTKNVFDEVNAEVWYNRTWFRGNAQGEQKRQQFPFFKKYEYIGFTDVSSASTGFRLSGSWGDVDNPRTIVGVDLRYLNQRLDEIGTSTVAIGNSPIPNSQWTNPGLFVEEVVPIGDRFTTKIGGRIDWAASRVIDEPKDLAKPDIKSPPQSLSNILGSSEFDQSRALWSVYATGQYAIDDYWNLGGGLGHGERPPSLTELYAAQTFLFVLQNGANNVTGDPLLKSERVTQVDLGLNCHYPRFRAGANGFFAWAQDYITFENMKLLPPGADWRDLEQESLKYVNTDLATFVGTEAYAEYDTHPWLTPFITLKYVVGVDQTRNGNFATLMAQNGQKSERVYSLPRGHYSGVTGAAHEPLPGIVPLESRVGLRLHQPQERPGWGVEFSARIVDAQEMVATSLLEQPTPGFTVFDIRGYWEPRPGLRLLAGVENVADLAYREHLDFLSPTYQVYQPGRNIYFGGQVSY